jgi:hypothetical protein
MCPLDGGINDPFDLNFDNGLGINTSQLLDGDNRLTGNIPVRLANGSVVNYAVQIAKDGAVYFYAHFAVLLQS